FGVFKMGLSSQEKMHILLKQLALPEELVEKYFDESALEKVVVRKKEQSWHFYIHIPHVLPFSVYEMFLQKLRDSFASIASVKLYIEATEKECEAEEVVKYWQFFHSQLPNLLPTQTKILAETSVIENGSITLTATTDAEVNALKRRGEQPFQSFCEQVGLKSLPMQFQVHTTTDEIAQYRDKSSQEDQKFGQHDRKKQEEKQEKENNAKPVEQFKIGYPIQKDPVELEEILEEERNIPIQGYVFISEVRELRSGRSLLILKATDYTDSLEIKMFSRNDEDQAVFAAAKEGIWIKARGRIQTDQFSNELTMMATDIQEVQMKKRTDNHEGEKRVELHAHTTMSQLDAVMSPSRLIQQAHDWGHSSVAITDHAVVQGFPEAHQTAEKLGMKVLYGIEANLVDDGIPISYQPKDISLNEGTYVVFDVETTGLSSVYDTIIELAGVKMYNGEIIDRFERFANPHRPLPEKITDITGITDDMLVDAPEADDVLQE